MSFSYNDNAAVCLSCHHVLDGIAHVFLLTSGPFMLVALRCMQIEAMLTCLLLTTQKNDVEEVRLLQGAGSIGGGSFPLHTRCRSARLQCVLCRRQARSICSMVVHVLSKTDTLQGHSARCCGAWCIKDRQLNAVRDKGSVFVGRAGADSEAVWHAGQGDNFDFSYGQRMLVQAGLSGGPEVCMCLIAGTEASRLELKDMEGRTSLMRAARDGRGQLSWCCLLCGHAGCISQSCMGLGQCGYDIDC